jgi:hypothetical protein
VPSCSGKSVGTSMVEMDNRSTKQLARTSRKQAEKMPIQVRDMPPRSDEMPRRERMLHST